MTKFEKLLGAGGKDVLAKRAKNLAGITSIEVTSKVNELQKNILMLEAKINDLTDLSGETSYDLRPGGKDFNPTKWLETILKQEFQSLICELNMPLRSGSQSSFSNITLNFGKPSDEIRDELKARGIILEDTPQGVRWHLEK